MSAQLSGEGRWNSNLQGPKHFLVLPIRAPILEREDRYDDGAGLLRFGGSRPGRCRDDAPQ
jgi:hypothetical protein